MKTMKWTLLLAFFTLWACQEQLLQEEVCNDSSSLSPRVERLRTIKRVDNAPATRAVGVKAKLWQPGDTIRIKFQNADEYPGMSDKVIQYAAIWLQYANLHFEYVNPNEDADVKIGFNMDTRELAWSTIGTDCKQIPQDEVSLNFYGLEGEDESGIKSEILKGFGHILGLGFEHKNPNDTLLVFINSKVEIYYNLSEQDVIELTQLYNTDQTNYTDYDPKSIMTLDIPKNILTLSTQQFRTFRNNELSNLDTIHIAELYPFPVEPEPEDGSIFRFTTKAQNLSMLLHIYDDITITWGDGLSSSYGKSYSPERIIISFEDTTTVKKIKFFGSNTALVSIQFDTDILSIDATGSKKLKRLICREHGLKQLEISHNKQLEELFCDRNELTTLTLDNPKLNTLICDHNQINALDVAKCPLLIWSFCSYNQLKSLDVTENDSLLDLVCSYNSIDILDLSNNTKLNHLDCEYNNLTHLNLTEKPDLTVIATSSNKITSIVFSNNNSIHTIYSPDCLLETLDVRSLKKLRALTILNNPINQEALLDIANNIVDNSSDEGGGVFHFSPVDNTIEAILNSKGWTVYGPNDFNNLNRNYAFSFRSRSLSQRDEILKEKYIEYFVR